MPCTSTGYIVIGNKWKEQSQAAIAGPSGNALSHAERQAFNGLVYKPGPYLIVQDAFPCFDKCHKYFLQISASVSVIIKVTANKTFDMISYVQKDLVTAIGCFPWYIYYKGGIAIFSMGIPGAPNNFPAHPSPIDV